MIKNFLATLFLGLTVSVAFAQKMNSEKLDSLFQLLDANHKFMGSIAIAHDNTILYSKAIGKADVETNKNASVATKYRIGSISKMFTASLIFKAVEKNKISLNQTIDKYFPGIEHADIITISNLLNHRSGIHNFTDDEHYTEYNTQPKTTAEMLAIITAGKSDFEPDSKAAYSNSNYVLLSFILEKIYNKQYAQILQEQIIKPLGLKNTYYGGKINIANNESYSYSNSGKWDKESETDPSIPKGAGAVVSNPTDLTVFIQSLFNGQVVSPQSLATMKTLKDDYGMGLFQVPFNEKKGYGHTGGIDGFESVVYYFPDDKVAIAITSNGSNYTMNDIVIAGLCTYFKMPFVMPSFSNVITKTEQLDPYIGTYSSPDFPLKVMITKEGLTLYAQATGQSSFPLDATAPDIFEFKKAGIKLEFIPAQKQMILKQGPGKYTLTKE